MKYLVQTGVTPQLVYSKVADVTDDDEERQQEIRREASDFIRKIISGTFAVRSYDYFIGSTHLSEMITFTSTPWNWHAQ